jgi:hypothetical protein
MAALARPQNRSGEPAMKGAALALDLSRKQRDENGLRQIEYEKMV